MDGKMQKIANAGNGNHNYIDNMREAKKVLMDEFSGTLYTIAKDVKIQIEFNPAAIDGYRMIGYENRVLAAEDFNNDKKDAGEMGADHTVTVLYELIPKGVKSDYNVSIDPLKYQENSLETKAKWSTELGTIKYRYKSPTGTKSIKSEEIISNRKMKDLEISPSSEWASYVAEFGLLLRDSQFKSDANYDRLIQNIKTHLKSNPDTYKEEMLDLVVLAQAMGGDSE
jgi:Ca-activated chloride channel family protein